MDRWVPLVQYIHHGDTRRAQVCTALGAAGVEPPQIDGWGFERAAAPDLLREFAERGRSGWRAYLEAGPDHDRVVPTWSRPVPAWVMTLQAVHHASEHIAHVGTILGANGLPVPDVDVWAYHTALTTG